MEVVQSGRFGLDQVEQLPTHPHLEHRTHHLRGLLSVQGRGNLRPVSVNVLLDSGSGVTTMSEAMAVKRQQEMYNDPTIEPFQGSVRVCTVEWQPIPMYLVLITP